MNRYERFDFRVPATLIYLITSEKNCVFAEAKETETELQLF